MARVLKPRKVDARTKEVIVLVIAAINDCDFWLNAHAGSLRRKDGDDEAHPFRSVGRPELEHRLGAQGDIQDMPFERELDEDALDARSNEGVVRRDHLGQPVRVQAADSIEDRASSQDAPQGRRIDRRRILDGKRARDSQEAREGLGVRRHQRKGTAAREVGVEIGGIRLVAAHAWDVAGAMRAGAAAAFVARPGMVLDPLAPRPEIVGADLNDVVDQLLAVEAPR